jgi:hypothetical protein
MSPSYNRPGAIAAAAAAAAEDEKRRPHNGVGDAQKQQKPDFRGARRAALLRLKSAAEDVAREFDIDAAHVRRIAEHTGELMGTLRCTFSHLLAHEREREEEGRFCTMEWQIDLLGVCGIRSSASQPFPPFRITVVRVSTPQFA